MNKYEDIKNYNWKDNIYWKPGFFSLMQDEIEELIVKINTTNYFSHQEWNPYLRFQSKLLPAPILSPPVFSSQVMMKEIFMDIQVFPEPEASCCQGKDNGTKEHKIWGRLGLWLGQHMQGRESCQRIFLGVCGGHSNLKTNKQKRKAKDLVWYMAALDLSQHNFSPLSEKWLQREKKYMQ